MSLKVKRPSIKGSIIQVYDTSLDSEVDPQSRRFSFDCRESDFARQRWPAGVVFITAVPITKLFAWGEGGDSGGVLVLRETTSRGLCGLVCPSHTSERG
jgi:hypothetical protein